MSTEVVKTTRFSNGLTLNQHYDSSSPMFLEDQCGSAILWQDYIDQLSYNTHEYYNQPNGTNKFFSAVTIHVYSRLLPFPNSDLALALTWSTGVDGSKSPWQSDITIQYFDPSVNAYRFPAALSHEMGHAYHNWCGFYGAYKDGLADVAATWEKLISSNKSVYTGNETQAPWTGDKPWEQFANTYRCLFGTYKVPAKTRGQSNTAVDPVIAGFNDPGQNGSWKKGIQMLAETCAMIKAYGCKAGTMTYNGVWQFQTNQGVWVYQDDYYSWYQWAWSWTKFTYCWQKFNPTYTRN